MSRIIVLGYDLSEAEVVEIEEVEAGGLGGTEQRARIEVIVSTCCPPNALKIREVCSAPYGSRRSVCSEESSVNPACAAVVRM